MDQDFAGAMCTHYGEIVESAAAVGAVPGASKGEKRAEPNCICVQSNPRVQRLVAIRLQCGVSFPLGAIMRSALLSLCVLPLLFTSAAGAGSEPASTAATPAAEKPLAGVTTAAEVFGKLGSLVGDWIGTFENGREHRVSYRLSAGGSVLVETWALAPGRESITMYYVDGEDLLATHYCPQGNQPTLRWTPDANSARFDFALKDGGNLSVPGGWHQQLMWLRIDGAGAFSRSETYVENGSTPEQIAKVQEGGVVVYRRAQAGP
jgi:hypothetical protein